MILFRCAFDCSTLDSKPWMWERNFLMHQLQTARHTEKKNMELLDEADFNLASQAQLVCGRRKRRHFIHKHWPKRRPRRQQHDLLFIQVFSFSLSSRAVWLKAIIMKSQQKKSPVRERHGEMKKTCLQKAMCRVMFAVAKISHYYVY